MGCDAGPNDLPFRPEQTPPSQRPFRRSRLILSAPSSHSLAQLEMMFLPMSHEVSAAMTTMLMDRRPQQPSPPAATSKALKFGMDRILADTAVKTTDPQVECGGHQQTSPVEASSRVSAFSCQQQQRCCGSCDPGGNPVPCAECVSSLLHCCTVSGPPPLAHSASSYPFAPLPYLPPHHNHLGTQPHYATIYNHDLPLGTKPSHSAGSPNEAQNSAPGSSKRKRSWSRAVFSNLQRKGLEKRFQIQKYITKPDRRQLAATLGLTDAQVKVWFQNRRMKWRHSKEAKLGVSTATSSGGVCVSSNVLIGHTSSLPLDTASRSEMDRSAADSTQVLESPLNSSSSDSEVDVELMS
ncbi:Hypothetical predicted protein [Cloeon dipterum]|uniref:Homeobox domain-containing protein n=1 Tax=Cloeon dipterum TaxID=197152 RepID=A0A8S1CLD6_9INSE|nr:Hypothetical predicted protein [Cloeon dipterum]